MSLLFNIGVEGAKLPVAILRGPAPTISLLSLGESMLAGFRRRGKGPLCLRAGALALQTAKVHDNFKLASSCRKVRALTF